MKLKVLLLSMTMLLSFIGSSIFGLKGDEVRAVKLTENTENATTEEEVREDASHAGETTEDKDSTKDNKTTEEKKTEEPTTQEVPSVVVPENSDTTKDPEVDTTKGKYKITITPEEAGWFNDTTNIVVKYEYLSSVLVEPKIEKVEAKAGSNGTWVDITDEMKFEVNENCTVYVKITDHSYDL